ncbi:MAG: polysaccharide biosynthesis protein [Muribaculaceae bacterium]|nr:polysaccharide biosynthesis protein [Muribaculaceae bacterium]
MIDLNEFISKYVTERSESLFTPDLKANDARLRDEIEGRSALVIGGAGSIGASFIRALLRYNPSKLVVVDINENGLAELTRDLRSDAALNVPEIYLTYTLNFADPIFEQIFRENGGFDIVANFSAHKHVRSEKDRFSVRALLENNDLKAKHLLDLLKEIPPRHFFCVSTDKAANPVNIMGASKRVMEEMVMAYSDCFKVTTARFANVAFSNGSLPDGWVHRLAARQPLVAPSDVERYFVSPEESGQICLLACILGRSGEIFFPKLEEENMKRFSDICDDFVRENGLEKVAFESDAEARINSADVYSRGGCPVYYFRSDTTGEKAFEEFFTDTERVNFDRFASLGVVEETDRRDMEEINAFFKELTDVFARQDFTKEQVVEVLRRFLPNFSHEELGRNLDQKM